MSTNVVVNLEFQFKKENFFNNHDTLSLGVMSRGFVIGLDKNQHLFYHQNQKLESSHCQTAWNTYGITSNGPYNIIGYSGQITVQSLLQNFKKCFFESFIP